jgi:heterodisulfide reductase subunit A
LQSNPQISHVNETLCQGDGACVNICPYGAIQIVEKQFRENSRKVVRPVAQVNPGLCQGCGACTVTCRAGAMDLLGYTNESIMREVDALCQW